MERRLFTNGGYYIDNGVSVCGDGANGCHMKCETGEVSCRELRKLAAISLVILPDELIAGQEYDKWGNYFENGAWYPGPLFGEEGVQKILRRSGQLYLFATT
jgi:hypothetical protein